MSIHLYMSILFCIFVGEMKGIAHPPMTGAAIIIKLNMQNKESFNKFSAAINHEINRRLDAWGSSRDGHVLLRHLDAPDGEIRIQPTYSYALHNVEPFIKIARSFDYEMYITTEYNAIGVMAPVLNFYPNNV